MLQRWELLTFLHWPYESSVIQRLLPEGLSVDTFEGRAWVGLVPFRIAGLRFPFGPALPWLSAFPETNVRTYVRGPDGTQGVWFFTLEADRLLAVAAARLTYHLPYRWAKMRVSENGPHLLYKSARRSFGGGHTDIAVEAAAAFASLPFDHFLTARFRLYTSAFGRLAYANIQHEPWSFRHGQIHRLDEDVIQNSGLPRPIGEPVVHVSQTVNVAVERLRFVP